MGGDHGNGDDYSSTTLPEPPSAKTESSAVNHANSSSSGGNSNNTDSLWKRAAASAVRGGVSGGIAMVFQVFLLMWLHTAVSYQYKTGASIAETFSTLWEEGGLPRFYRGVLWALLIAPLSRFGDTAANEGVADLFLFASSSGHLPNTHVWVVTFVATLVASVWRIVITPIDTVKTTLQVVSSDGNGGWDQLMSKIHTYGIGVLWDGAFGNWLASMIGYYPWYAVNNWLEWRIPAPAVRPSPEEEPGNHGKEQPVMTSGDEQQRRRQQQGFIEHQNSNNKNAKQQQKQHRKYQQIKVIRRAFIGLCASFVSTGITNGIRVVKTYGQTSEKHLSYFGALAELFRMDGFSFLFRGLELRLFTNCLQGVVFSILWKMFMDQMKARQRQEENNIENHHHQHNNNDDQMLLLGEDESRSSSGNVNNRRDYSSCDDYDL